MISVIIPTYNRNEDLEACLKSIRECSRHDIELIVMHPKLDEFTDIICARYSAISINDGSRSGNKRVKSLWAIINEGIALASNRYVCWLNDDCLVLDEWDIHVINYFKNEANLALLVLKTKGIDQNPNFIISHSEYGIPVANYGVLDKYSGYRFDEMFSWYYGDVDLPMQIVRDRRLLVLGSKENMIIHNHRIDINREKNNADPRSQMDNAYFKKKWWPYKSINGKLARKNIFEYLKIKRAIHKAIKLMGFK